MHSCRKRSLCSSQAGGIRFLYDNIVESKARFASMAGFGCILAHSMGLGKTLQVISFIDIFLRHLAARHVLCVVPVNTLQNWVNEFDRWLPAETDGNAAGSGNNGSNGSCGDQKASRGEWTSPVEDVGGKGGDKILAEDRLQSSGPPGGSGLANSVKPDVGEEQGILYRSFKLFLLADNARRMDARLQTISLWRKEGGVLLIGYEMFRLLSLSVPSLGGNKMATKRKKQPSKSSENKVIDLDETEKEMDALIGNDATVGWVAWWLLSGSAARCARCVYMKNIKIS